MLTFQILKEFSLVLSLTLQTLFVTLVQRPEMFSKYIYLYLFIKISIERAIFKRLGPVKKLFSQGRLFNF
jgi:hypothetical protein